MLRGQALDLAPTQNHEVDGGPNIERLGQVLSGSQKRSSRLAHQLVSEAAFWLLTTDYSPTLLRYVLSA